jgi:hypothetical protein
MTDEKDIAMLLRARIAAPALLLVLLAGCGGSEKAVDAVSTTAPSSPTGAPDTTPKLTRAQAELSRRSAQSNLRAAESIAAVVYTNADGQWSTTTLGTDLARSDMSLTWNVPTSASTTQIGYTAPGDQVLVLAVWAKSGDCYFTRIDNSVPGGTYYKATHASSAHCDATAPVWSAATDATTIEVGWA